MRLLILLAVMTMTACSHLVTPTPASPAALATYLRTHESMAARLEKEAATGGKETFDRKTMTLHAASEPRQEVRKNKFRCMNEGTVLDIGKISDISLSYNEANIREVLSELATNTGVAIVMDEGVEGQVSVTMNNVSLPDALDMILAGGGYSYKVYGSYILVGPPDPRSRSFARLASTCIFKPENTSPDQLVQGLPAMYQPYVAVQTSNGELTVTAPMDVQKRIQATLTALDQTQPQVLLEMSVVEVSVQAMDILGVSFDQVVNDPRVPSGSRRLGAGEWSSVKGILTGTTASRTLAESVQFLQQNGEAEIRATPSIITQDGAKANFSSHNTVWLPFDSTTVTGNTTTSNKMRDLTYGIDMTVVPKISSTGMVRLAISDATVSDLVYNDSGEPQMVDHHIANTVDINDGNTLVLGGLFQRKHHKQGNGLPGLSRLRVLGGFFGQDQENNEETEVLIMIRPTIISPG